jgi:hypothetical protein
VQVETAIVAEFGDHVVVPTHPRIGLVDDAGEAPQEPAYLDGELESSGGPVPAAPAAPHLGYHSDVIEVFETYGYRPVFRLVIKIVAIAKRLQSGRLDAYMLIAVITVVTAMA